jgi:hypothetical protein
MKLLLSDSSYLDFTVKKVFCAGYAGRNQKKVQEHIEELSKIGVPAPPRTPTVYPVGEYLLNQGYAITVQGTKTSGEVEFVLFLTGNDIFVSVGSDHTDRDLEKINIPSSKQVCEKSVAAVAWNYKDVAGHWDSLVLRSWVKEEKGRRLYQEGKMTALLPVPELIKVIQRETVVSLQGTVIYSGTVPAIGGFSFAKSWDLELEDPILKRSIKHHYDVIVLEEDMAK